MSAQHGASRRPKSGSRPQSPKAKLKVGTQHGDSDDILKRAGRVRREQHLQQLPSAKMDETWSVEALSKLPRARRVARHLARHGAAADELVGDLARRDAGDLSWARARSATATSTTSAR